MSSSSITTPGQSLDGNVYEICHLAVARARQIQRGTSSLVATDFQKPTSQALEELASGKVRAYTQEEWADEEERRAAEVPAPLDEVLEIERPVAPEVIEEVGGFSGFLNAVMTAEDTSAKGAKAKARVAPDEDPGNTDDEAEEEVDEEIEDQLDEEEESEASEEEEEEEEEEEKSADW